MDRWPILTKWICVAMFWYRIALRGKNVCSTLDIGHPPFFFLVTKQHTVDFRYLDFGYLEQLLISKKKSGPCLNIEI